MNPISRKIWSLYKNRVDRNKIVDGQGIKFYPADSVSALAEDKYSVKTEKFIVQLVAL